MTPPEISRIWVLPGNDLEAVEIRRLLEENGQTVLVSEQAWGATWEGLETAIRKTLERTATETPETLIHGIELAGPNGYHAHNVDHHRYRDEDRSHPLSSLEQVAAILRVPLNRRQQLIAANDRAYIPGMLELGATPREIDEIRAEDRRAQGVTAEQELQAEQDLAAAAWLGDRVVVACHDAPTSAHMDRLFGKASEILLTSPREWSYSGPRHRDFAALSLPEQHWSGGVAGNGYFGAAHPGSDSQRKMRQLFERRPDPD